MADLWFSLGVKPLRKRQTAVLFADLQQLYFKKPLPRSYRTEVPPESPFGRAYKTSCLKSEHDVN